MVKIYWVEQKKEGKLGIMARPRGGEWLETEIIELKNLGINNVISLLEIEESIELELNKEEEECEKQGIEFLSYPVKDRNVPESMKEAREIGLRINQYLGKGKKVAIHCRQGIGRAGVLATIVLLEQNYDIEKILSCLTTLRGCSVPETSVQKDWLLRFQQYLFFTK